MLNALLGEDGTLEPLKRLLIERTEGNPFFLEESVRTLVETKALVGQPGAYTLAMPLQALHIPATVQAVLAARIDRLPANEKSLLQSAAVIGKDVAFPLLHAIADLPDETLRRGAARWGLPSGRGDPQPGSGGSSGRPGILSWCWRIVEELCLARFAQGTDFRPQRPTSRGWTMMFKVDMDLSGNLQRMQLRDSTSENGFSMRIEPKGRRIQLDLSNRSFRR